MQNHLCAEVKLEGRFHFCFENKVKAVVRFIEVHMHVSLCIGAAKVRHNITTHANKVSAAVVLSGSTTTRESGARSRGQRCKLWAQSQLLCCGSLLHLTDPFSSDADMFEPQKLQTESSAFQTKPPNDKRHRGVERAWLGALPLGLLVFGSSRPSAAKRCALGEHFSPGGFPSRLQRIYRPWHRAFTHPESVL